MDAARYIDVHLPYFDVSDFGIIDNERSWMHPELGKWFIAGGIVLTGSKPEDNPVSWRLAAAIFGTAGVAIVYGIGLVLWRSPWWAGFSSLLITVDGLHLVQSRTAMLDIFVCTLMSLAMLFVVLEWRRRSGRDPAAPSRSGLARLLISRWMLALGVTIGLAVATKWSAIYLWGPIGLGFAIVALLRTGGSGPAWRSWPGWAWCCSWSR